MSKTDNPYLKIIDKFNIQNVVPNRNMIYDGDLDQINTSKVKHNDNQCRPLAAAVVGLNNTAAPFPRDLNFYHTWTDIDSQEVYLNSKPTCYVILGKPGSGEYSLGESMAKKMNLVHISPKSIILDEIEQGGVTGKCIDFNLRHNIDCKYNTIMAIMKKKLESPVVKHRGYVLSGLPIVTSSKSMKYYCKKLHDEDAVSISEELLHDVTENLRKKVRKGAQIDSTPVDSPRSSELTLDVESELEEEEQALELHEETEQIVALPKFILEPCSGLLFKKSYFISTKVMLLNQCQELFDFNIKPDIIILVTSPDTDAVNKRSRKYFNYLATTNIFGSHPFIINCESEMRWPSKYTTLHENSSSLRDNSTFNQKYHCRMPINFVSNSSDQMCNYKNYVKPYLDKKLKDFEPKFILKLDGRNPPHEMINLLQEKLMLLNIKPVLIPEPLYLENSSDNEEDFWKLAEDMNIIKCGLKKFRRYASPWYKRCPIELKKRHVVQGFSKFAVSFFKHIYLCSSLDAMVKFCRNPRPFLKLQYLEPTCRVIVLGTKSSGKSMISQCLSWLFDAPVISYEKFTHTEKQKKYDAFSATILSEIIASIEDNRIRNWKNKEESRISYLNAWITENSRILQSYILLLKEYQKKMEIDIEQAEITAEGNNFLNDLVDLQNKLSFLPLLEDIEICQDILDSKKISLYAPPEFCVETPQPAVPALGDEDVTKAISAFIVENNLEKDVEPLPSELMEELIKEIKSLDRNLSNSEYEYGKYIIDGFPSDVEIWKFLLDSSWLPDYIISVIENREIDEDVAQHYININTCNKEHETRLWLVNDDLIKTKLCSKKLAEALPVDIEITMKDLIHSLIESIFVDKNEFTNNLNVSIDKFREDWDSLKINLNDTFQACIEVQIENKTDIDILEEVLLKIRRSYCTVVDTITDEVIEDQGSDESGLNDTLFYSDPRFLCETYIYCPVAYYDYGVLWEGKPEFCLKYENNLHYFCKEEFLNQFQNDVTKYQSYNKPFKNTPPLRICVMGCIGSGKSTVSKLLAKEYGLIHIDFAGAINYFLLPRHYRRVGRQFENSFTDPPIDDDMVTDFNVTEENMNFESDIFLNENELRTAIFNYLEKGTPLLPFLMKKILKILWFQSPFSTTGFVLDGFPKMVSDVENMIQYLCIPDLIIELESTSEISSERLSSVMFNTWKIQLNEEKNKSRIKLDNKRQQWFNFITKNIVVKLIIDEILSSFVDDQPNEVEKNNSIQSAIIDAHPSGLSNVDANLFNTYNNMVLEYPEPIDENEWEKPDDVREKIITRIEGIYEIDEENIQNLKDTLTEQNFKTVSVDGTKSFSKVSRILLSKVTSLRDKRDQSFEQTFVIDPDVAEMLLLEGFFFLSKFHRMCPVFIYHNSDAISNPYTVYKAKNLVIPVLHRSHIYFICREDYLRKFRENPLMYVINDNIKSYKEFPLKIAILGPPKSGKSELTAKLAKKYGLLCVSKGMAVRYFINNLPWTKLALQITTELEKGQSVNNDLILTAVQTIITNHCTTSRGFILDGFPASPFEFFKLQKLGIFPLIIFDIHVTRNLVIKNSQNEIYADILKRKPPYSAKYISYRLLEYNKTCDRVRELINNDTQNIYILNGENSRWKCFYEADSKINEMIPKIHYYLSNNKSSIVRMEGMSISNDEFELKMSRFKNMCPICLRNNIIKHSGHPFNKKGIVKFKENFYWICNEHIETVLKNPEKCLLSHLEIPEIPVVVKTVNYCNLYEEGICMVTYAENLPGQRIKRGNANFAVTYKSRTYLFCSSICLSKFLGKPHIYYDIPVFKETKMFPQLLIKKLPHIGYLEQTLGNIITEACCSVSVLRPKYPGLSVQLSAILYIALFLKIHNPLTAQSHLPLYSKAYQTYESRCKLMTTIGLRLRSVDNPFGNYPKCCITKDNMAQSNSDLIKNSSSLSYMYLNNNVI